MLSVNMQICKSYIDQMHNRCLQTFINFEIEKEKFL